MGRKPVGFAVTNCDFKAAMSSEESWKTKSPGKRLALRFTAWLSALVGTP